MLMFFLLIFIGGAGRLIVREEKTAEMCSTVRESFLATPAVHETGHLFVRSLRSSFDRYDEEEHLPVTFVLPEIRTDANGTVISGRRSYLRLRYQAFSLSDGFV